MQTHWFCLAENVRRECAERSVPPGEHKDGPTFALWNQKAKHFVWNVDEANHMACYGSDVVVADGTMDGRPRGRKKKEKNKSDSRVSITGMECGNAAGFNGPTGYLMKGEQMPASYQRMYDNPEMMEKFGAPPGSFVVMTPSAYLRNEHWALCAENICAGMRAAPVVCEHPNFWIMLCLDGYAAHVMTFEAQVIFTKYKVMVLKENSHSSSFNQAYDQGPAAQGKRNDRLWMPEVRDKVGLIPQIDQWHLLNIVMAGQKGGRDWTAGFKKVNLHPDFLLPTTVYLAKISDTLVASGGTDNLDYDIYDDYVNLIKVPEFVASLSTENQLLLRDAVAAPDFEWTAKEVMDLPAELSNLMRTGDNLYKYFKFKNQMEEAIARKLILPEELTPEPAKARKAAAAPNSLVRKSQKLINKEAMAALGNHSYSILGGAHLTQEEQFAHACQHRQRFESAKHKTHIVKPSVYLDLEISKDQQNLMDVDAKDFGIGAMLAGGLDQNLGKGLAARKLNFLGEFEGLACIANDPKRVNRLKQLVALTSSIEMLKLIRKEDQKQTKHLKEAKMAEKEAKKALLAPIIAILTEYGFWNNVAEGIKGSVTIRLLTKFLQATSIYAYVPPVPEKCPLGKSKSIGNLKAFVLEVVKQKALQDVLHSDTAADMRNKHEELIECARLARAAICAKNGCSIEPLGKKPVRMIRAKGAGDDDSDDSDIFDDDETEEQEEKEEEEYDQEDEEEEDLDDSDEEEVHEEDDQEDEEEEDLEDSDEEKVHENEKYVESPMESPPDESPHVAKKARRARRVKPVFKVLDIKVCYHEENDGSGGVWFYYSVGKGVLQWFHESISRPHCYVLQAEGYRNHGASCCHTFKKIAFSVIKTKSSGGKTMMQVETTTTTTTTTTVFHYNTTTIIRRSAWWIRSLLKSLH